MEESPAWHCSLHCRRVTNTCNTSIVGSTTTSDGVKLLAPAFKKIYGALEIAKASRTASEWLRAHVFSW